ncbi:GTP-binding protein [Tistlia consotensis]|uniref:Probable GTP-binding protein EngB n=2 Tax=Tistlia TaxID=1321364 RepID=A0A1Y6B642_9PROT|nr:GTP-binding protein [Tistlia consotensis USBA 355]SNR27780.1 GTP-binding protein [Tistlia consotensis]
MTGSELEADEAQPDGSGAELEAGRKLFAQRCDFVMAGVKPDDVPASDRPEIAFAGRSNVGKSSLVNALTGRKTLARASNTPGRTRQLIFFDLAGRLMLVDLPGYGYAKAPKQDVALWTGLTRAYLKGRPQLRRVLLLIDSRHGLKDSDREVMTALDKAAVSYQVVLTKADKPKPDELSRCAEATAAELAKHVAAHPAVAVTSAESGQGIAELRAELALLALPAAAG